MRAEYVEAVVLAGALLNDAQDPIADTGHVSAGVGQDGVGAGGRTMVQPSRQGGRDALALRRVLKTRAQFGRSSLAFAFGF